MKSFQIGDVVKLYNYKDAHAALKKNGFNSAAGTIAGISRKTYEEFAREQPLIVKEERVNKSGLLYYAVENSQHVGFYIPWCCIYKPAEPDIRQITSAPRSGDIDVGDAVRVLDGSKADDYAYSWTRGMNIFVNKIFRVRELLPANGVVLESLSENDDDDFVLDPDNVRTWTFDKRYLKKVNGQLDGCKICRIDVDEPVCVKSRFGEFTGIELGVLRKPRGWFLYGFIENEFGDRQCVATYKISFCPRCGRKLN